MIIQQKQIRKMFDKAGHKGQALIIKKDNVDKSISWDWIDYPKPKFSKINWHGFDKLLS